jgi:hypothetical protein
MDERLRAETPSPTDKTYRDRQNDACPPPPCVHWQRKAKGRVRVCYIGGVPRGGISRDIGTRYWYIYPRINSEERIGPFAHLKTAQRVAMRDYFSVLATVPALALARVLAQRGA